MTTALYPWKTPDPFPYRPGDDSIQLSLVFQELELTDYCFHEVMCGRKGLWFWDSPS
jgi:hypothetical protein